MKSTLSTEVSYSFCDATDRVVYAVTIVLHSVGQLQLHRFHEHPDHQVGLQLRASNLCGGSVRAGVGQKQTTSGGGTIESNLLIATTCIPFASLCCILLRRGLQLLPENQREWPLHKRQPLQCHLRPHRLPMFTNTASQSRFLGPISSSKYGQVEYLLLGLAALAARSSRT